MSAGVSAPGGGRHIGSSCGVTVFHVDLADDTACELTAPAWLDEAEHHRRRGLRTRARAGNGRAALRVLLTSRLLCCNRQLSFATMQHGKPFAQLRDEPAPVSSNVSHGGRHGLIALVAQGQAGVDGEERTGYCSFDLLVDATFGPAERAGPRSTRRHRPTPPLLRAQDHDEGAVPGHSGPGLLLEPTAFDIRLVMCEGRTAGTVELPDLPGTSWRVEDPGDDQYAAAAVYELSPAVTNRPGVA